MALSGVEVVGVLKKTIVIVDTNQAKNNCTRMHGYKIQNISLKTKSILIGDSLQIT